MAYNTSEFKIRIFLASKKSIWLLDWYGLCLPFIFLPFFPSLKYGILISDNNSTAK